MVNTTSFLTNSAGYLCESIVNLSVLDFYYRKTRCGY